MLSEIMQVISSTNQDIKTLFLSLSSKFYQNNAMQFMISKISKIQSGETVLRLEIQSLPALYNI